jgi:predicted transcriptional regulator
MLYISVDVRRITKEFAEFWFVVKEILTELKKLEIFIKNSNKTEYKVTRKMNKIQEA